MKQLTIKTPTYEFTAYEDRSWMLDMSDDHYSGTDTLQICDHYSHSVIIHKLVDLVFYRGTNGQ